MHTADLNMATACVDKSRVHGAVMRVRRVHGVVMRGKKSSWGGDEGKKRYDLG
jgi:hypothetical protein